MDLRDINFNDGVRRCHLCLKPASVDTWLEKENEPYYDFCGSCFLYMIVTATIHKSIINYAPMLPGAIYHYIHEKIFHKFLT